MTRYKNIRIKKRGGGTRLQRVKVLASGKYKFVKNPTRSRTSRSSRRSSNPRRRKSSKRSVKRKVGSKNPTIPLAIVTPLAATVYDAWNVGGGDFSGLVDQLSQRFTGFSPTHGWVPSRLMQGIVPLILGALVHKYVGGKPLNLNRYLRGVPLIRI